MSATTETMPPAVRRVRAYFAPVTRGAKQPTIFDPAQQGMFALDSPPAPWIDLGWINGFARKSGTKIEPVLAGTPAVSQMQSRSAVDAIVSFQFAGWGKLQMALAAGTQQMNLLKAQTGTTSAGSGGVAIPAVALQSGSTATALQLGAAATNFVVGETVVVDVDYTGQLGFVGSSVSGAYVKSGLTDVDYVRRVSLNVARVSAIASGALTLEQPLLAGIPASEMKVKRRRWILRSRGVHVLPGVVGTLRGRGPAGRTRSVALSAAAGDGERGGEPGCRWRRPGSIASECGVPRAASEGPSGWRERRVLPQLRRVLMLWVP